MPDRKISERIAGVDEAGRGPLAGPVVAAAVVLNEEKVSPWPLADSKTIGKKRREEIYGWIMENAAVGVGYADHAEIDRINILQASLLAMKRAVLELDPMPDVLLIDGTFTTDLPMPMKQKAVVRGDATVPAISAASIVAKVTRDRMMDEYHLEFPRYGFDRHKGYPTRAHKQALAQNGPTPIHRKSFKGVKQLEIPSA